MFSFSQSFSVPAIFASALRTCRCWEYVGKLSAELQIVQTLSQPALGLQRQSSTATSLEIDSAIA